jgi:hypothetical protein
MVSKRMKYVVAASLFVALTIALSGVALAAKEEVRIRPGVDDNVTIGPGQVAYIGWGWLNCSRGLTEDWIRATDQHYVLMFEGQVVQEISAEQATKLWGTPQVSKSSPEKCVWPARNTWEAWWKSGHLRLVQPGTYQLQVYMAITEPLIDGFDILKPRREADWYEGVFWSRRITIIVKE